MASSRGQIPSRVVSAFFRVTDLATSSAGRTNFSDSGRSLITTAWVFFTVSSSLKPISVTTSRGPAFAGGAGRRSVAAVCVGGTALFGEGPAFCVKRTTSARA